MKPPPKPGGIWECAKRVDRMGPTWAKKYKAYRDTGANAMTSYNMVMEDFLEHSKTNRAEA